MPRKRQKAQAAPTEEWGGQAELVASQKVVPLPNTQFQPPAPGAAGQFARPSEAPDEPITAGAPFGPGRGSMGNLIAPVDTASVTLRALYARHPNSDLARLIEVLG